ncbi:MAG TPA: cupredoxin domain-containing protein [Candidatus Paceibacterota bacterium]
MKNTLIVIVVLVLIALGFVFFIGKGNKVEAPVAGTTSGDINTTDSSASVNVDSTVVNSYVPPAGAVKEFTVTGKEFSFSPSLITVKKGDRVKITFVNSAGFHDFKIDEFGAATKQTKAPTTEVLEFTADKVGSFEYYCSVGSHRAMGMKGILKVE